MPVLDFQDPSTGKTISVLVPLTAPDKDRHEQIGDDGKVYKRVYSAPLAARDTRSTEASKDEFRRITDKNGIKLGEMYELAAEMSARRAERNGVDEVKEQYYRNYERENGVKCVAEEKEEKARKAKEAQERGIAALRKAGYIG